MTITFSCQECGRKLRAPATEAGQSAKCPGCGTMVTCPGPEPIYEAELIDPAAGDPAVFDASAEVTMSASPVLIAAPGTEARRPCPMCGEMIIATAKKCRFCGEVFDDTLRRAGRGGARSIATTQKRMMTSVVVQVALGVALMVLGDAQRRSHANPMMPFVITGCALGIVVAYVTTLVFTIRLAALLDENVVWTIILGLIGMVPCLGLVISFLVNQRATARLLEEGYDVGFFGAREA